MCLNVALFVVCLFFVRPFAFEYIFSHQLRKAVYRKQNQVVDVCFKMLL